MIFCARATRGRRLPSLDARSGRSISPHPWRENKRAWREHLYRSIRAVCGDLVTPLSGKVDSLLEREQFEVKGSLDEPG